MLEAFIWFIFFGFTVFLLVVVFLGEKIGFLSVVLGILIWIVISFSMSTVYKETVKSRFSNISKALENKEPLLCRGEFIVKNYTLDKERLLIIDRDRSRIFELLECEKYKERR